MLACARRMPAPTPCLLQLVCCICFALFCPGCVSEAWTHASFPVKERNCAIFLCRCRVRCKPLPKVIDCCIILAGSLASCLELRRRQHRSMKAFFSPFGIWLKTLFRLLCFCGTVPKVASLWRWGTTTPACVLFISLDEGLSRFINGQEEMDISFSEAVVLVGWGRVLVACKCTRACPCLLLPHFSLGIMFL